jgi:hypothetical protein
MKYLLSSNVLKIKLAIHFRDNGLQRINFDSLNNLTTSRTTGLEGQKAVTLFLRQHQRKTICNLLSTGGQSSWTLHGGDTARICLSLSLSLSLTHTHTHTHTQTHTTSCCTSIWAMNHSQSFWINYSSKPNTKHFANCPGRGRGAKGKSDCLKRKESMPNK